MLRAFTLATLMVGALHGQDFGVSSTYLLKLNPVLELQGTHLGIAGSAYLLTAADNQNSLRATVAYYNGSSSAAWPSVHAFDGSELSFEGRYHPLQSTRLFATGQLGYQMQRERYVTGGISRAARSYSWFTGIGLGYPVVGGLSVTAKYSSSKTEQGIRVGMEQDF